MKLTKKQQTWKNLDTEKVYSGDAGGDGAGHVLGAAGRGGAPFSLVQHYLPSRFIYQRKDTHILLYNHSRAVRVFNNWDKLINEMFKKLEYGIIFALTNAIE